MDLNEFVKDVIVSIYDGLSKAKEEIGHSIIPTAGIVSEGIPYVKSELHPRTPATTISNLQFEVSLTDGTKDGVNGGIGVMLGNLTIGTKGSSEYNQTSLSKIKFNIPIELR